VERAREADARQKLSQVLGCPPAQVSFSVYPEGEMSGAELRCEDPLIRRVARFYGEINPEPIRKILKGAGVETLTVDIWIPHYGSEHCEPEPKKGGEFPSDRVCSYALESESGAIRYSFGYDAPLLLRITGILGFLLLLPIVLTLWIRRRALNAREETKAEICFAYFKFLKWGTLGGGLIWWSAIDLLHADDLVAFLILPIPGDYQAVMVILPWILLWCFPAAVYFLCLSLSMPMQALRGTKRTQRQILNQAFWSVARFLIPISLFMLGIAELFGSPRVAVLLFVAAVFTLKLGQRKLAQAYGLELHSLTSGELRDRAFAIAQKARAKLNQLYVMPTEQLRMANAFAHVGNNIFLTDYLIKNLSKREVDAIIGHEMTHLQKRHIGKGLVIVVIAMLAVGFGSVWTEHWIPEWFPVGPAIYAVILAGIFFRSRRNEFAADAGAVKLTGDPEAMITSLVKVSRLNTIPLHWGKMDEKILTHPSTLRRITRMARSAGIPEEQIPELIRSAAAPPADVYAIPSTALPAGKIFSTRYKTQLSMRIAWVMLLTAAAVPAATALIVQRAHLYGTAHWVAYGVGLLMTIAVELVLANFLPLIGNGKLERRLREKLEKQFAPQKFRDGLIVGMSPDASPRIYEGNWSWDSGFLTITGDRLDYQGEEAQFSVGRDEMESIALGSGPVGWWQSPSLYVTWQDAAAQKHVCNVRVLRARSMRQMARKTRLLAREMQDWSRGIQLPVGSLLAREEPRLHSDKIPGTTVFGQVTSMSPRKLVRGVFLVRLFGVDTFITLGVGILCGLRLSFLDSVIPPPSSGSLELTGEGMLYILCVVWFARAFQLWPYWRFREDEAQASPVAAAVIHER
jgi:Zn-dependent protease with chaperone function